MNAKPVLEYELPQNGNTAAYIAKNKLMEAALGKVRAMFKDQGI